MMITMMMGRLLMKIRARAGVSVKVRMIMMGRRRRIMMRMPKISQTKRNPNTISPILTVSPGVKTRRCQVRLTSQQLQGSSCRLPSHLIWFVDVCLALHNFTTVAPAL